MDRLLKMLIAWGRHSALIVLIVAFHSRYCFGIMFKDLHAPLIDSPAATRLLTLLTIAILSEFVKRRLLLLGVLPPATIDSILDAIVASNIADGNTM
jgi:hypothetical protein